MRDDTPLSVDTLVVSVRQTVAALNKEAIELRDNGVTVDLKVVGGLIQLALTFPADTVR